MDRRDFMTLGTKVMVAASMAPVIVRADTPMPVKRSRPRFQLYDVIKQPDNHKQILELREDGKILQKQIHWHGHAGTSVEVQYQILKKSRELVSDLMYQRMIERDPNAKWIHREQSDQRDKLVLYYWGL